MSRRLGASRPLRTGRSGIALTGVYTETEMGMLSEPGAAPFVEPMAAAFVASVPAELPADPVLPPTSIVWRLSMDLLGPVLALRSFLLQALHPLAMAGVAQYSNWQINPYGRIVATAGYVNTLTFGDRTAARKRAHGVRALHEHVRGTDGESGELFAASDPHLLLWVHIGMVDSYISCARAFGDVLTERECDDCCRDMAEFAELIGIARDDSPRSMAALTTAFTTYQPELRCSAAARDATAILLDPPGLDAETSESARLIGAAAVSVLPEWARQLYGWSSEPITPAYRTAVRQELGVLDIAFELEPGVLEARQRVQGWMRAARR